MNSFTASVGPHIGVLIRFFTYGAVAAMFFFGGTIYTKYGISESTTEVLQNDSVEGNEISQRDEELKNEIDLWLENNDPVDSDGKPSAEWLQLLESQRAIARERGDQGSIIRKFTKL